jgi:hypothetical protein
MSTSKNIAKKETMYLRSIKKTDKGANFSGGSATFEVSSEEATCSVCPLPKPPKEFATFNVDIDFNEASLAWRSNKQSVGNGGFEYKTYEKPKRTRRAPQRYSA